MTTGNRGGREIAPTRSADELRGEAVEAAHGMIEAYERNETGSFHLYLGMLVGLGQLVYEANTREMEKMTIQELQRERARLWDVFMEQGGRGVDLADRIDALDAKMLDADELLLHADTRPVDVPSWAGGRSGYSDEDAAPGDEGSILERGRKALAEFRRGTRRSCVPSSQ